MTTPLDNVPVQDRINAIESARSKLLERYWACTEELEVCKAKLEITGSQLLALQGLNPPTETPDGPH